MKKTFIRILSVSLAMITMLIASMLPVSAAERKEYKEISTDVKGNRLETLMHISYTYESSSEYSFDKVNSGAFLYTGDTIPTRSTNVYLQTYIRMEYKISDEQLGYTHFVKGYLLIERFEENSAYIVNNTERYGGWQFHPLQNQEARFFHVYSKISEDNANNLSKGITDLYGHFYKYYTQILYQE